MMNVASRLFVEVKELLAAAADWWSQPRTRRSSFRLFSHVFDEEFDHRTSASSSSRTRSATATTTTTKRKRSRIAKTMKNSVDSVCSFGSSNSNSSSDSSKSVGKHVMFSDTIGMQLELVHTLNEYSHHHHHHYNMSMLANRNSSIRSNHTDKDGGGNALSWCEKTPSPTQEAKSKETKWTQQMEAAVVPIQRRQRFGQKTMLRRFNLTADANYNKLVTHSICLNSVDIYNRSCIRGTILTLTKPTANESTSCCQQSEQQKVGIFSPSSSSSSHFSPSSFAEQAKFLLERVKHKIGRLVKSSSNRTKRDDGRQEQEQEREEEEESVGCLGELRRRRRDRQQQRARHQQSQQKSKLDLVYVIWSVDEWHTWKYELCIQNNCKANEINGIIKTHEFFIQNVHTVASIGQTLRLIVCHQIDTLVYRDTNNDECYNFECAFRI